MSATAKGSILLYDQDFFEWTRHHARLLREGRVAEADLAHLAEEIEDVGKRDQREVWSRLEVLLVHLLKWTAQPDLRYSESGASSWRATILEQRSELEAIFEQSPSLRRHARESLERVFREAVEQAMYEINMPRECFSRTCPFSFEQLMDRGFVAESAPQTPHAQARRDRR